jgi:glycine cleavage system H protein
MVNPENCRYTQTHEWHKLEGKQVTIGLTRFAVDALTDITFVDVTRRSGAIQAGESFGEIESVKATSELYSGVDGNIVAVNQDALANPAAINEDPFGKGWLIKVEPKDPSQLNKLMSAKDYDQKYES